MAKSKTPSARGPTARRPFKRSVALRRFLDSIAPLSLAQRRHIVEQAALLLDNFYAHLPMKRAMHAVDPIRRLRLIGYRLSRDSTEAALSDLDDDLPFHYEMADIFKSLRDLHTSYLLPAAYRNAVVFLPFQVRDCYDRGHRRYLVSHVGHWFEHSTFLPGVEITYWNGVPIDRAVELVGAQNGGSNAAARHARGVAWLTNRPLIRTLPPDEEWVVVGYRDKGGRQRTLRFDWRVFVDGSTPGPIDHDRLHPLSMALGIDIEGDSIQAAKKRLFAPHIVEAERRLARHHAPASIVRGIESTMPAVFQARVVEAPDHRRYAYIRIRTFLVPSADAFVAEFLRLLEKLPPNGLIIDVRDNSGGLIMAAEQLLQVLTPRRIEPERLQLLNTPLSLPACHADTTGTLSQWVPSLERAGETGASYSGAYPISALRDCNAIGQRYHGPVVLLTNALCYSATDIFIAGFRDHEIGKIIGVDPNTGAGGANVWTHEQFRQLFAAAKRTRKVTGGAGFRRLPGGVGLRVAFRRTLRVRAQTGTELEELGVIPDILHHPTARDVLNQNADLIASAIAVLEKGRVYELSAEPTPSRGGRRAIEIQTANLDRVDIAVDGRPRSTWNVNSKGDKIAFEMPGTKATHVELSGFRSGSLVASRKIALPGRRRRGRRAYDDGAKRRL